MLPLSRARNLPDDYEPCYWINMHGTDTGCALCKYPEGWTLSDPGKPYGNVTTWPTLRAARADLARVAAAYRFHPTGNGLERIADGFRPSHLSQALLLTT